MQGELFRKAHGKNILRRNIGRKRRLETLKISRRLFTVIL